MLRETIARILPAFSWKKSIVGPAKKNAIELRIFKNENKGNENCSAVHKKKSRKASPLLLLITAVRMKTKAMRILQQGMGIRINQEKLCPV